MPHSRHMPNLGFAGMLLRRMEALLECARACCNHESNIVLARSKSNKAKIAKSSEFPKYSIDLMPLDNVVWDEVERRMSKQKIQGYESVEALKNEVTSRIHVYPCSND